MSVSQIKEEYFSLFIGVGRGELLPYASYYLTGFLNEKPLGEYNKLVDYVKSQAALQLNSISKGEERFEELEDEISAVPVPYVEEII